MEDTSLLTIPLGMLPTDIATELSNYTPEKLVLCLQIGSHILNNHKLQFLAVTSMDTEKPPADSSAAIGARGEDHVENILKKDFLVTNVTRKGYAGDMIVRQSGQPEGDGPALLVEVKNYTSTVPGQEVEKFYRDLRTNTSVRGGVFISLNTKITGIPNSFYFTHVYESRKIPVIFVSSSDASVIHAATMLIFSFLNGLETMRKETQALESEHLGKIYEKIHKVATLVDGLSTARTHINEMRDILGKQISRIYEDVFTTELQIQQSVDKLLRHIREHTHSPLGTGTEVTRTLTVDMLNGIVREKFADSLWHKSAMHRMAAVKIVEDFLNGEAEDTVYNIQYDKKIYIASATSSRCMVINPMKTKTGLGFKITNSPVLAVPREASYADGWVLFNLEKDATREGAYEPIAKFLTSDK